MSKVDVGFVQGGATKGMEPDKHREILERLDNVEEAVNRIKVPASFADQFYVLPGHITFVRGKMMSDYHPR